MKPVYSVQDCTLLRPVGCPECAVTVQMGLGSVMTFLAIFGAFLIAMSL